MKMTKIISAVVLVACVSAQAYLLQPNYPNYYDVQKQEIQLETQKKKADINYKQTKVDQKARKEKADLDRKKAEADLNQKKAMLPYRY